MTTRTNPAALAGLLLMLAGSATLMSIITAEAVYEGAYSTGANDISDLGRDGASALIFNTAMIVTGVLVSGAAYLLYRAGTQRLFVLLVLLMGVGSTGVGVFPADIDVLHGLFAAMTFIAGGVAAIVSSRLQQSPLRYVSMALGAVALISLALYAWGGDVWPSSEIGDGGIERWVAYPIVLWQVSFGASLTTAPPNRSRSAAA